MTTIAPPSPRQQQIVDYVRAYRRQHGYAPTLQEMADNFDVSKVTIFEHLGALRKKGVIKFSKYRYRSTEIIADEPPPSTVLPIAATINGSGGWLPTLDELDLGQLFNTKADVYAVRVRGEGFAHLRIHDGDFVIIARDKSAKPGAMVMLAKFIQGEEAKTLGSTMVQVATSIQIKPYEPGNHMLGVVIGVVRDCRGGK